MAKRRLTKRQKQWIIARDGGKCVLCGSTKELHVHHILSHRLQSFVVGGEEVPETPLGLVTLCRKCHVYNPQDPSSTIHPDISWATSNYHHIDDTFGKVFKRREKKLRREVTDKPLWNHEHDFKLQQHAIYATLDFIAKGHKWPK